MGWRKYIQLRQAAYEQPHKHQILKSTSLFLITALKLLQIMPGAGLAPSWLSVAKHRCGRAGFGSCLRTELWAAALGCGRELRTFLCTSGLCDTARTVRLELRLTRHHMTCCRHISASLPCPATTLSNLSLTAGRPPCSMKCCCHPFPPLPDTATCTQAVLKRWSHRKGGLFLPE